MGVLQRIYMSWLMYLIIGALALFAAFLFIRSRSRRNWIVVDGSNVLYWDGSTPNFESVREIVDILKDEGYQPLVWFDANVGYLIRDRYLGPVPLARMLQLPSSHVFVAQKGTPADPLLLKGAHRLKTRVVTNDRFRDWEDSFPMIREEGFLVRGYIKGDRIGLEWEQ